MAYATDNGHDSSSTRSGGRPHAQASMSALTAASSSNYATNVFSDSQRQNQSGGIPGTPVSGRSRRSGGWDRQTLSPAAAARAGVDDPTIEDHSVDQSSSLRPKEDLDDPFDSSDSSDSSDEYMTSYRPLEPLRLAAKQPVIQHTVIIDIFEGQLHLAPISSKPRRVLDVGTGPGAWALPPYTRSNCSFMAMDITHDWDFTGSGNFDFIHIRQLGDIQDKKKLVQSTFDNLKPGGWVEFTEWIAILQSPNHSLDGTAFRKWNDLLEQGMRSFGTTLYYPNKFKPLLQETGFEHIIETRNGAPTNACYPGKKLQRIGHLMTQNWLLVLEPLTMPVFTQALGWSPDQVKSFLVDVRKEIGNTQYHSFMTLITICAQKPLNSSSTSSKSASASASASASESSLPTIK
ncbi:S-adenosyl-L-methionine-dependent methyltransferase [Fusarium sp. MPI-SDFR-AT-0072]|nr:S-adenosyl-L-methionine-dependent methyltransferase [Fusarium sp. MPI-SDFR-AT-0072]